MTSAFRLEVNGGVNPQIGTLVTAAGADTLIAGSTVFKGGSRSYAANIAAIRAAAPAGSSQLAA